MSQCGAGLLIYRPEDGRLLLTRRSSGETSSGVWDSAGGSLEPGETELEAAIREATEELGKLPRLMIDDQAVWWAPHPFFAFALFLAVMKPGQLKWKPVLNQEHDRYGWFRPGKLPVPHLPALGRAVGFFFPAS